MEVVQGLVMLFPVLKYELKIQQDDRTRLDASESFVSQDEASISSVRIRPDASGSFIDVTQNKYLDWAYAVDGSETITVEIDNGTGPITKDYTIEVLSVVDDYLFADDSDLISFEPDLLRFVRKGRHSFKDIHREVQTLIIAELDEMRIWDEDGNKLTKAAVVDVSEVREWAKFYALKIIMEGQSKTPDDVFSEKAKKYAAMRDKHKNRAAIRLDRNGDGIIEDSEAKDLRTFNLRRR